MLTKGLMKNPGVEIRKGRVTRATLDQAKGWTVDMDVQGDGSSAMESGRVVSSRVILCTGSSPNEQALPVDIQGIEPMNLDTGLTPSVLAKQLASDARVTVAVIGASHSAILVLRNLCNLALTTHPNIRIKWFTRHPLRYAEYMEGWILRDNTGLKGEAADWARANLEDDVFSNSPVSKVIKKIFYKRENEIETYKTHLPGCDRYIQAIGYKADPIPHLKRGVGTIKHAYNHGDGSFTEGTTDGEKIPGLYGAGIAWPEQTTDPHGNVEYAVGFGKFMRFVKRVSCNWN